VQHVAALISVGPCSRTVITNPSYPTAVQEQPRVYGALVAMRILARKYEYKDEVR
jgi:hypothetical protein